MVAAIQRYKKQGTQSMVPDQIIYHSLANAWNFSGALDWLLSPANPLESHFALRYDGALYQLVDTRSRADANYRANRRSNGKGAISIETDSSKHALEPWSNEQIEVLVELSIELCREFSIPPRPCPAWDAPGLGYHIMFGTPGPWTPVAKACPGPARIIQSSNIVIPRVASAFRNSATPPPTPAPPTTKDWLDMATEADLERIIRRVVREEISSVHISQGVVPEGREFAGLYLADVAGATLREVRKISGAQGPEIGIFQTANGFGEVNLRERTWRGFSSPQAVEGRKADLVERGLGFYEYPGIVNPEDKGWVQLS